MSLSPEFVVNKDLRKEVGILNKCGALKEVIKDIIGKKRNELVKEFLDKVDGIPEDAPEAAKIPASVITFYNSIVDGTDPTPEEIAEKNVKKAKRESKPRGPSFEQRAYELVTGMNGETPEKIKKAAITMYTELYAKKDPPKTDAKFIESRTDIYLNIANKKINKELAPKDATA